MIALGCDHAGLELKNIIKDHLDMRKIEYKDFGTYTPESTDYAVYAELAAKAVASGECTSVCFSAARASAFPWRRTRSEASERLAARTHSQPR